MNKIKKLQIAAIILIFVSSYILMLAPVVSFDGDGFQKIMSYCAGGIFWFGLISGYVLFIIAGKLRKKIKNSEKDSFHRPGIIVFFSSRAALIVDVLCIISIVMFIICIFNKSAFAEMLEYFIISTTIFLVQMHAVINGINFRSAFINVSGKKNRGGNK